jgi:hypothetical protein
MTRKKRQQASERMKQIWAQRKAKSGTEIQLTAQPVTPPTELQVLEGIIRLMDTLSPAGRQYLVNRFM